MSEVKLLPLEIPARFEFTRQEARALMRDYARANMEPLIAENERLAEALRPFVAATLTPTGVIVGLVREDFERAKAALAGGDQ